MSNANPRNQVTLVIHHRIALAHVAEYRKWLERTTNQAATYPGHLGVNVIEPSHDEKHGTFTIILHFASEAELQNWLDSDARKSLIREVMPLLEGGDQVSIQPTNQFWFTPEEQGTRQPLLWKQAVLTLLVIYPLTLLFPWLWQPAFSQWPTLGNYFISNLLITLCIVLSVVYLIMPAATRLLADWLQAE